MSKPVDLHSLTKGELIQILSLHGGAQRYDLLHARYLIADEAAVAAADAMQVLRSQAVDCTDDVVYAVHEVKRAQLALAYAKAANVRDEAQQAWLDEWERYRAARIQGQENPETAS